MLSSPRKRGPITTTSGIWIPACAGTTALNLMPSQSAGLQITGGLGAPEINAGGRDAYRARAGVSVAMIRARAHACAALPADRAGRGYAGDARRGCERGRAPFGDGYAHARAAR